MTVDRPNVTHRTHREDVTPRPQNIEDRMLALAEKATPGPWTYTDNDVKYRFHRVVSERPVGYSPWYGDPEEDDRPDYTVASMTTELVGDGGEDNAAFIASCSPEVVAAMCRVVAAGREEAKFAMADCCNSLHGHDPSCERGKLLAALAALDEMGRKA